MSENKLYGIVNNAGIGLNTGVSNEMMLKTNLYGPKLVCDNFLDLLDQTKGRIVNLGSGGGPNYVAGVRSIEDKRILCSPDSEECTWQWIENYAEQNKQYGYGLTKAMLACYTGLFAREHPNILTSCVSPGFIVTQMTEVSCFTCTCTEFEKCACDMNKTKLYLTRTCLFFLPYCPLHTLTTYRGMGQVKVLMRL